MLTNCSLDTALMPYDVRWLFPITNFASSRRSNPTEEFYSQLCCFHPLDVYTNPPPPFCSRWFPQSTAWPQQSTEMALERPL